ncbi:MAG TPA: hypothetical protein VHY09_07855 [Candidatus Methylacidiphilales bacterium]|jgi:predicted protein tyrosine phosphatase|nr:hypothetical protein [Candidatus Methylacidiphilales bacterium]
MFRLTQRVPPPPRLNITIAGLLDLEQLKGMPFTRVISICEADLKAERGYEVQLRHYFPGASFHFAYFDDVEFPREGAPDRNHVYRILLFSQGFTLNDRILIHCRAGISRSTAIACAITAQHSPPGEEKHAVEHIRSIRPLMLPNFLIIKLADEILQRQGKLVAAVAKARGPI